MEKKNKIVPWENDTQKKNLAWFLPRPKRDHYKGGMPLYCEEWLFQLAFGILKNPDAKILQVFCGMNKYGTRVDINPEVKPDYLCDVHELSKYVKDKFDIIFADPPYSNEESKELYNTPKLSYKKWSAECDKLLNSGGLFIVYHKYVMPNPNPDKYFVVKRVFIGSRPLHLARVAIIFQKK
jgi:hypothetical protein